MDYYTDSELFNLAHSLESHLVERKRNDSDSQGIHRNMCAFANDLADTKKPGVIFVGIEDNGDCAQIRVTDDILKKLANMRSDGSIQPFPTVTVDKRRIDGCEVAVIQVAPSEYPPVRYRGRVWIRTGPTVEQATAEEEQRLTERRRSADLPFDMCSVPESTIEDLDTDYIRTTYLPSAVSPEVLERNQRSLAQQLNSLRLLNNDHPTRGALICLSKDPLAWFPGASVQFLRFSGTTLTDPINDQKMLNGRLPDMLLSLDALLKVNLAVHTDITSGSREIRQPDYPLVALQQITRNAVMHRSYENTNAPVKIHWYADRVEVQSPGGLYGRVTPQNIGTGVTDYRNPLIAEVMRHTGFAQRFGVGIPLAQDHLSSNGNPPLDFNFVSPTHVAITLRPAQ